MKKSTPVIILLFVLTINFCNAQVQNVDKIIAVIGKHIVLRSDIESTIQDYKLQGKTINDTDICRIYEEFLFRGLLLAQAEKDSVDVKDEQVDAELDRRMEYYLQQFGTEENFISFYGKTPKKFKEELRDEVKDQLVIQQMQSKVLGDAKVTPAQVRSFFKSIPDDSLPLIGSEVELGQLLIKPVITVAAKKEALDKLEELRQRVLKGESMSALATLYTDDPGSAKMGGKYEGIVRGQFVPEFEKVAFAMKPGEVSEVFETTFGYHFVELLARRGEQIDVRHILAIPRYTAKELTEAKEKLDSIYNLISSGKLSFCKAVELFSDEKETRQNCGIMVNPDAGTTRFEVSELGQIEQNLVFLLDKMNVGDVTKPTLYVSPDNKQAYRMIYLKSRSIPHRANLKDDYQRIQNLAIIDEQKKLLKAWITKKSKNVYFKLDSEYQKCKFEYDWAFQLK